MDIEKYIADNFTDVKDTKENMLFYTVRKSIYEAVTNNANVLKGRLLDIGCGVMPYRSYIMAQGNVKEYIGMDITNSEFHNKVAPDLAWDGMAIPLENETVDSAMATEFFEHYFDTQSAMREIHRVLRTDGVLFGTVPFIWNLHEIPYDMYRFTPYSLQQHLEKAGFYNVTIGALGGWKRALAQFLALYTYYSPRTKNEDRFIRRGHFLIRWLHSFLFRNDVKPTTFDYHTNSLYSGLYFIAYKK